MSDVLVHNYIVRFKLPFFTIYLQQTFKIKQTTACAFATFQSLSLSLSSLTSLDGLVLGFKSAHAHTSRSSPPWRTYNALSNLWLFWILLHNRSVDHVINLSAGCNHYW